MNEYNFTSGYFKALSQNLAEKSEDNLKAYRKDAVDAQNRATASTAATAAADREANAGKFQLKATLYCSSTE